MNVTMLFHFQRDELAERNTFKTLAVRFDRIYEHRESCNLYQLPRWVDSLVYLSLHLRFFVACLVSIHFFLPLYVFVVRLRFFSLFLSLLPVYVLISLFMSLLPSTFFLSPFISLLPVYVSLSLSLSQTPIRARQKYAQMTDPF